MGLQDDVLYLGLLLASIAFGKATASLPAHTRKMVSTSFGLALVFLVSGLHGLHCVVAAVLQCLLLLLFPKSFVHVASFWLQFSYLLFFRLAAWAMPDTFPPYPPHTNAVMMMLTLKVLFNHFFSCG